MCRRRNRQASQGYEIDALPQFAARCLHHDVGDRFGEAVRRSDKVQPVGLVEQCEIGRIDFGPYINGQDYQVSDLVIGEPYLAGGKAVVKVTFRNFDTPQELGFLLVDEDGWKIYDVWGGSPDYSYDLLDILQSPLP